jgi:hypothetical protein
MKRVGYAIFYCQAVIGPAPTGLWTKYVVELKTDAC